MNKFTDLFSNKKQAELYNVEYQFYGDLSDHINFKCEDNISILEVSNEKLRVLVNRQIKFNPQNLFSVSASYFVDHFLKKTLIGKIKWEEYNIQAEIEANVDYFTARETDRLSLIISQVTGSFVNSPIITPPIFEQGSKVKKEEI